MSPETRMEIEQTLIVWVMRSSRDEVLSVNGLVPELFHNDTHQAIVKAFLAKVSAGEAITPGVITDLNKQIEGIKEYVMSCLRVQNICYAPLDYIRSLAEDNRRCKLLDLAREAIAKGEDVAVTPKDLGAFLVDGVNDVLKESSGVRIRDSRKVSDAVLDGLKEIAPCYPTGIRRLDDAMDGGFYTGKAYGIAAKKKVGKTIIASTISCNLDLAGVPHLFICGEMSDEEVHQRTMARLARVYPSTFRNRERATPATLTKIAEASFRLTGAAKYLNAPGITLNELKRAVMTAVSLHGIKGFILDYWQLVGGKDKSRSTAEHLDEVAQWIADFGRKNGLWSLTMAQINQEGNTRGGEGMRLAFDQVYHMQPCNDDITDPRRWLEMMDTRYTAWRNVGEKHGSPLRINDFGPYFEETL